jgi:PhnB protein
VKAIQAYLNFDGDTREAMSFYKECLGGTLTLQTFGEIDPNTPADSKDRVMHARLEKDSAVLMASDTMKGNPFYKGNNLWLNNDCSSVEELDRVFVALSQGGTVLMPPANQFWGARFAMLIDKFGVNWMCNCELPKS